MRRSDWLTESQYMLSQHNQETMFFLLPGEWQMKLQPSIKDLHLVWQWSGTTHKLTPPPCPGFAAAWRSLCSAQPFSAPGVPGPAVDMLPGHSPPLTWPSQSFNSSELSIMFLHYILFGVFTFLFPLYMFYLFFLSFKIYIYMNYTISPTIAF